VPAAKEIIFENLFFLSSLGITPKTRVAKGFNCLFSKTTQFWSKQNDIPDRRRQKDRVLTITPYRTSPFLTLDVTFFSNEFVELKQLLNLQFFHT